MAPRTKTNSSTNKATASGVSKTAANTKTNSTTNKATASGATSATANIQTRSMTRKSAAKSKGKPTGISKKSILRAPGAASTHKMSTRNKKTVHFADTIKTTAYFAAKSTTPTSVPPPPPRRPNPNKRVFYLPNEHMEAFRQRYEAAENPEDFDWKWVQANMVQLPLGKTGPKGCIKLEIILPEELGFLVFPGQITVVDTEPYSERAGGGGGKEAETEEEEE
jgi:hypothetical protein